MVKRSLVTAIRLLVMLMKLDSSNSVIDFIVNEIGNFITVERFLFPTVVLKNPEAPNLAYWTQNHVNDKYK